MALVEENICQEHVASINELKHKDYKKNEERKYRNRHEK